MTDLNTPDTTSNVLDYADEKTKWAWRRIEKLVTLYVNGDPDTSKMMPETIHGPSKPWGEHLSIATAMQANIPLEPIRELWARAKAHMVELEAWRAENASDGGPAA
jgi:hypothetical protein